MLEESTYNIKNKTSEFSSKQAVTIEDIKKEIQKAKEKNLNKSRNSTIHRTTTYIKENQEERFKAVSNSRRSSPIHYLNQPVSPSRVAYESPEK